MLLIHGEKAHSRYFSEMVYEAAAEPTEASIGSLLMLASILKNRHLFHVSISFLLMMMIYVCYFTEM